ncbi:hypothetical protein JRO89_XS11G0043200 [Xanthoceras sorbifolium]|uniref:Protein yippee-like n=1 Tax=Xanthoceras sorbifolium TaxID=99658 RepID=A0ABQ8HEN0_9ROSI|nr:hypothetical protein JRO89_XS11G0043200 [Xanthoceras sorbifolium]
MNIALGTREDKMMMTGSYTIANINCCKCGDVYMFSYAMNIVLGRREEKHLISGVYTIANIYCSKCGKELGWHYLRAHDLKNRCKEGNFIIEKLKMLKEEY